jgi:hypothetical protein
LNASDAVPPETKIDDTVVKDPTVAGLVDVTDSPDRTSTVEAVGGALVSAVATSPTGGSVLSRSVVVEVDPVV